MRLLACPDCHRAYDVSPLDTDERIRCVCGTLLTVQNARERRIEVLLCAHCGGIVPEGAARCEYCSGTLRPGLLCHRCGRALEADARHCSGCGAELVSQHLVPLPDGRGCPRCTGPLAHLVHPTADVIECTSCAGLWLAPAAFTALCTQAAREVHVAAPAAITPLADPTPVRYLACIHCDQLMMRKRFQHAGRSGPVVIDICRNHGIWLDHAELERLMEFVRAAAAEGHPPPSTPFIAPKAAGPPPAPKGPIEGSSSGSGVLETLGDVLAAILALDLFT